MSNPPTNSLTGATLEELDELERTNLANVQRPVEDFSEDELDAMGKEELVMIFAPKGVPYKNKNETQLRKTVKDLRAHKIALLEQREAAEAEARANLPPPADPAADASTNSPSIKTSVNSDDNKSVASRRSMDPPADPAADGSHQSPTPTPQPSPGLNLTDVSAIVNHGLNELGLSHLSASPAKPITYGELCRILAANNQATVDAIVAAVQASAPATTKTTSASGHPPDARQKLSNRFQNNPVDPQPSPPTNIDVPNTVQTGMFRNLKVDL